MRHPENNPQLFRDAVIDFLKALDVSMERIAPFAGLHPQQLRRLGKDGKHHTLKPNAITRLIDAPELIGKELTPEFKDAWGKHLKVSSLYTVLVTAAYRRTNASWPQTPDDHKFIWQRAFDLVLFSGYALFYGEDGTYKNRSVQGFPDDSVAIWDRWTRLKIESEEDIDATLHEIDNSSSS